MNATADTLVQGGGLLAFAVAILLMLRDHLGEVRKVLAEHARGTAELGERVRVLIDLIADMRDDFTPRARPMPVPRGPYGPRRTSTPPAGRAASGTIGGEDDER